MKLNLYFYDLIVPDSELYIKHKEIAMFCKEHGVSMPVETANFFRRKPDDYSGMDFRHSSKVPYLIKSFNLDSDLLYKEEQEIPLDAIHDRKPRMLYLDITS